MAPTDPEVAPFDGLQGLHVVAFESRRAEEMAELIRRHGGEPLSAPSVREVPLKEHHAALDYVAQLAAGEIDIVILMTGVGLRTLVQAVASEWIPERLSAALRRAKLIARGPKPVAALRELGLRPDITVPEPNTWREILATLDAQLLVAGKRVAVQEYGVTNGEFIRGLETRGAQVRRVPIYEWALPEDLGPLRNAITALCDATVDVALFTSATQVYHLFQVAGDDADRLRAALGTVLVASIGPVCSEALGEHGVAPDLEPAHAKMGQLVGEVARLGQTLLRRKRET
jgi:uroporphyrinogen-III synthase